MILILLGPRGLSILGLPHYRFMDYNVRLQLFLGCRPFLFRTIKVSNLKIQVWRRRTA